MQFPNWFSYWWLRHLLWNCPDMNVTGLHWWSVIIGSGNGLVPSGNKPLPEPVLTQISVAIWCHLCTIISKSQCQCCYLNSKDNFAMTWYKLKDHFSKSCVNHSIKIKPKKIQYFLKPYPWKSIIEYQNECPLVKSWTIKLRNEL